MSIGTTIRRRRGNTPLETLGAECGLSASALSMVERDKRNLSNDALQRIATALGTTVFDLQFEAAWGLPWSDFGAAVIDANNRKTSARFFNNPSLAGATA